MLEPSPHTQSLREEMANSLIHLAGFALSIAAVAVLAVLASLKGTAWHMVGCSIYGGTLLILYLSSTLYHFLSLGKAKKIFQLLDHSAIFLLIAGTYTPFMLVTLRGGWGWSLFGAIWGLAAVGILLRVRIKKRHHVISTVFLLIMGWLVVIALKPLVAAMPLWGFLWLVIGGLFYTGGVVFFALDRFRYFHAVWHLFVLAGSVCHFFSILFTVFP